MSCTVQHQVKKYIMEMVNLGAARSEMLSAVQNLARKHGYLLLALKMNACFSQCYQSWTVDHSHTIRNSRRYAVRVRVRGTRY